MRKLEKQLQEKEWDHSNAINARETRLVVPIQKRPDTVDPFDLY